MVPYRYGPLAICSVNSVPSFTVPGQSTSTFFFPALPELSTDRAYTYAFETAAHKACLLYTSRCV